MARAINSPTGLRSAEAPVGEIRAEVALKEFARRRDVARGWPAPSGKDSNPLISEVEAMVRQDGNRTPGQGRALTGRSQAREVRKNGKERFVCRESRQSTNTARKVPLLWDVFLLLWETTKMKKIKLMLGTTICLILVFCLQNLTEVNGHGPASLSIHLINIRI